MHSSTKLLPDWKACLVELNLPLKIMPRDVTTRWNSTFDMLEFSVKYRSAIEHFTSERKNDLRQYELKEPEWVIVAELCNILKVRGNVTTLYLMLMHDLRLTGPQGCYELFFSCIP